MRFRKRPIEIDAVLWDGQLDTKPDWLRGAKHVGVHSSCTLLINTLEGQMWCNIGDWIIKGVKGELYPCKPDIFVLTYEPVVHEYDGAPIGGFHGDD